MKIVNVVDFFHPNAGYENNILPKYLVKNGHQVVIVTARLDKVPDSYTSFFGKNNIEKEDEIFSKETGIEIIRLPTLGFISGRALYTKSIFQTINNLKPDLLFLCGNDTLFSMQCLLRYNKNRIALVLDSHMLEMASRNPLNKLFRIFYKTLITPIIIKNRLQVIRVQNDPYVEKHLGIPLSQAPFISFGSDTMAFHPDSAIRKIFRDQNCIDEKDFVIVYTGKLDEDKGGKFLAEAFIQKFETNRKVILLVVGNTSGEYGLAVEQRFKETQNRVIRFHTQKYKDLPKFYQSADLSIFPKQCSLSFFDAQACGLPVIAEDNNINIDRLNNNNGFTFKSGSIQDFRTKIMKCVEMSEVEFRQMKENATKFIKENYDYENIVKQYIDILVNEYDKFHRT